VGRVAIDARWKRDASGARFAQCSWRALCSCFRPDLTATHDLCRKHYRFRRSGLGRDEALPIKPLAAKAAPTREPRSEKFMKIVSLVPEVL
ncbi:hypothetical protein, partial [Xanthomonas campestris]|uniref:hypothetical protein n=1 Tax=Xanthomonas campestris TaxID=339 RepID=UPI0031CB3E8F|nr:hypothetical protein [Xanthomonas campestris pv. incanae]